MKQQIYIYIIKGIDYDKVIAKYRSLCLEGKKKIESEPNCFYAVEIVEKQVKPPRKPLSDNTKILNKIKYLIHSIAYRSLTLDNSEKGVPMQSAIMQKVLGKDYYELILALVECGYLSRNVIYKRDKYSRTYEIKGEITTEPCSNATFLKYIKHTKALISEQIQKFLSSSNDNNDYGDTFFETYVKNLNKFKIKDLEGLKEFSERKVIENPKSKPYYDFIFQSFKEKLEIYSIDNNNRIYHLLTSLKRELKQYLNIRFSIDCKNSHPLLFSYFIFRNRGLNIKTSFKISSILSSISPSQISEYPNIFHYVMKNLSNSLKDKNIDFSIFAEDELEYLWRVIRGTFWDDLLAKHSDFDRAQIKQKMFAEVFYSKEKETWYKEFAKEFIAKYPNVYAHIEQWKNPLSIPYAKRMLIRNKKVVETKINNYFTEFEAEAALSNMMMSLESSIFREVLQSLYRKRIACVHIHDAIVVPDTKSTQKVEPFQIINVMKEVYARYGLCPTLKIE